MSSSTAAVAAALCLAIAGCGGGAKTVIVPVPVQPNLGNQSAALADSNAKSDARNMVSFVEICFTRTQDYSRCATASELSLPPGIRYGSGPGQVEVKDATAQSYVVVAHSSSGSAFSAQKTPEGSIARLCTGPGSATGCRGGTW